MELSKLRGISASDTGVDESLYDLLAREVEQSAGIWMTTSMNVETTDKDADPPYFLA